MIIDSSVNGLEEKTGEKNTILPSTGRINFKEIFSTKSTNKELTGHKKRVFYLDWNMSGNKLASGSTDCSIRVNIFLNSNFKK
jgi:WD40 repeat protein